MKKYLGLIVAAVGMIVVLAGAGFLYSKLSEEYQMEPQLIVADKEDSRENHDKSSTSELESTADAAGSSVDSGIAQSNQAGAEETTEGADASTEQEDYAAIDFTVEDTEGNEVTLFSFIEQGKPIVLNFWASWCGPCKNELPDFQTAYEKYDGDIQFLMVNMTDGVRETKEIAVEFMEENGYTLPVYFDTAQEAAYTYMVYSLPTTYFISAEGELIAAAQGMIDGETLEKGIAMIYEGNQ